MYPKDINKKTNNSDLGKNTLDMLSFMELNNLQEDFRKEISYNDIRKKYNLKSYVNLNKDLLYITQDLKDEMLLESLGWNREDVEKLLSHHNYYHYGYVFWDKNRELVSVEDLLDFLEYNQHDFDKELELFVKKEK